MTTSEEALEALDDLATIATAHPSAHATTCPVATLRAHIEEREVDSRRMRMQDHMMAEGYHIAGCLTDSFEYEMTTDDYDTSYKGPTIHAAVEALYRATIPVDEQVESLGGVSP